MNKQWIYLIIGLLVGFGIAFWWLGNNNASSETSPSASDSSTAEKTIWTCSMHPQIRAEEEGLCPICEMDLIPLKEDDEKDPLTFSMSEEAVQLAQLETVLVGSSEASGGVFAVSGKININEDQSSDVVSYFPGKLEVLKYHSEGDYIPRGALVAKVFAPDLRIAQQELIRTYQRKDNQPELFEASIKKMEYWEVDSATIYQIAASGQVQAQLPIYAKQSGVISDVNVREGNYLNRGSVLFELNNLSTVWVDLDIHESDLSKVRKGQSFKFQTLASDQVYTARIEYIDPFVDPQKRTAVARATIRNRGDQLKPGMLVNAFIPFEKGKRDQSKLTIPASAVLWTGEQSVVYLQEEGTKVPSFRYVEVVLGAKEGDQYPVLSGLEEGDRVVAQGAFTLDAAAQLNNKKSMMNQWVQTDGAATGGRLKLNPIADEKAGQLLDQYISLKSSLVQSDSITAAENAALLSRALQQFVESIVNEQVKEQVNNQVNGLLLACQAIEQKSSLEGQREEFERISNILIEWVTHIKMGAQLVYVQHCPMAFNDEGADWLSYQEAIKNPYFGNRMLKCGITKRIIRNR